MRSQPCNARHTDDRLKAWLLSVSATRRHHESGGARRRPRPGFVQLNAFEIDGVRLPFVNFEMSCCSFIARAPDWRFKKFLSALRALLSTPATAYTLSTMFVYWFSMFGRIIKFALLSALALSAGATLSGCAATGSSLDEATFFSDPAAYAMYDCKQLATLRDGQAKRIEELQGLMTKAETGVGGSVIAEVAYRSDYVAAQARLKRANQEWERNRCENVTDPALAKPQRGAAPAAGRSTGRVY